MKKIIYRSVAAAGTTHEDINAIIEQSRANNITKGISGVLLFDGEYFVQLVEGEESVVDNLMVALMADPRHRQMTILATTFGGERAYDHFDMGFYQSEVDGKNLKDIFHERDAGAFHLFRLVADQVAFV